jgi:RNA polymerase sigma-70 factor, ECF subfamily
MTTLDDDLLELSMQHAAATPAAAKSLRDALWRRLHAEGWKAVPYTSRAFGSRTSGDDRTLLRAFVRGDAGAYEALVSRHGGALLSFAKRSLPEDDAEDAVQKAFIALYRKAEDVLDKPEQNVRAWLFVVTRYEAIDYHRRRLRAERALETYANEPTSSDPDASERLLQQEHERERARLIAGLVARCNPLEQDVVTMIVAGRTHAEIAKELDLTPNHVRVLKHRALTKLTQAIAPEGEP